jgi:hypothetical protein
LKLSYKLLLLGIASATADGLSTYTIFLMLHSDFAEENFFIPLLYSRIGALAALGWIPIESFGFVSMSLLALYVLKRTKRCPDFIKFWVPRLLAASGFIAFGNNLGVILFAIH